MEYDWVEEAAKDIADQTRELVFKFNGAHICIGYDPTKRIILKHLLKSIQQKVDDANKRSSHEICN